MKAADTDLYAGFINELCRAAGWNVMMRIDLTNARIPRYACSTVKDDWSISGA